MINQSIIVTTKSNEDWRLFHLHDLNSQVTLSYIDHAITDQIRFIDQNGDSHIFENDTDILEEYSFQYYEIWPYPGGDLLKISCKDNFNCDSITYIINNIDAKKLKYTDIQLSLTHTNSDGN